MPQPQSQSEIRSSLIKYAAFCLSRRPYFENSIRQKLIQRSKKLNFKDTTNVIPAILNDLKNSGYLDDQYLAQAFARRQLGKYYGPRIISLKLKRLQVDQSTINLALEEAGTPQQVAAMKKFAQKYRKLDKYRLTSKLYARGFGSSAINILFDSEYIED